jgi:Zn-dependent metalloprotease
MFRTGLSIFLICLFALPVYAQGAPGVEYLYESRFGQVNAIVNKSVKINSKFAVTARATLDSKQRETQAILSSNSFMAEQSGAFGINDINQELYPRGVAEDNDGSKSLTYEQLYHGIPVYGGELVAQLNANNEVLSVVGRVVQNIGINSIPKVSAKNAVLYAKKDLDKRYNFRTTLSIAKRSAKKECRRQHDATSCFSKKIRTIKKYQGFYQKGEPQLIVYSDNFIKNRVGDDAELAWHLYVMNDFGKAEEVFVNATFGNIISHQATEHDATNRMITDCSNHLGDGQCYSELFSASYNYWFGRREGRPERGPDPVPGVLNGSRDVDTAYDWVPTIHTFYESKFGRNGGNNQGGLGDGTCPSCSGIPTGDTRVFVNANGTNGVAGCNPGGASFQYFPKAAGVIFCRGSMTVDVFGHEYAHSTARYKSFNGDGTYNSVLSTYQGETGALNESNSDLVGVYYQYYIEGESGPIDWVEGNGSNTGGVRSLSDPPSQTYYDGNTKPFPDNYNSPNFMCDEFLDFGGVHINSTVPSHAAYIAAVGGTFNSCQIQGIGFNKMQQIWYKALKSYFTVNTTFNGAYNAIGLACDSLATPPTTMANVTPPITFTPDDCVQVRKAMQAVEMDLVGGCNGNVPANNNFTPTCAEPVYSADFDVNGVVNLMDYQILRGRWNYPNIGGGQELRAAPPEGDANLDGLVNMADYDIWKTQFIEANPGIIPPPAPTMLGDLDFDGDVDANDYTKWFSQFGQTGLGILADADTNGTVNHDDLLIWANHFPGGIAGDYNHDGVVDLWDYNYLKLYWHTISGPGLAADINLDGVVSDIDYEIWRDVYGQAIVPFRPTLPGDFDGDGWVDSRDYTTWRANFGNTGPGLGADGNVDAQVDASDYTIWRKNWGLTVVPNAADFNHDGNVDLNDYDLFKREFLNIVATKNSDANKDLVVDSFDYMVWANSYTGSPVPPMPTVPGDANGDGVVDGADYVVWRKAASNPASPGNSSDLNGDGVVDALDYDIWRSNF